MDMRAIGVWAIFLLLGCGPALAQQGCAYPTSAVDGCAGAPTIANAYTVMHSNFFTSYALQSGQTYVNPHPPQWNVAGVDYLVGINAAQVNVSSLKSPANIGSDPNARSCSFNATKNSVLCTAASNTVINGYDFSQPNGCTVLVVNSGPGSLTIENSYFTYGPTCNTVYNGNSIAHINNTGNIQILNNYFWGNPSVWTTTGDTCFFFFYPLAGTGSSTNQITIEYNAFVDGPSREFETDGPTDIVWKYNYLEGLVWHEGQNHGEAILSNESGTQNNQYWQYSTFLQPSSTYASAKTPGVNAISDITVALSPITIGNVVYENNVSVANLPTVYPGYPSVGTVGLGSSWTITNLTLTNNWLDPVGAYFCFRVNVANNVTETGNADLRSGNAITGGQNLPGPQACNGL
jgi:hypothetical protein